MRDSMTRLRSPDLKLAASPMPHLYVYSDMKQRVLNFQENGRGFHELSSDQYIAYDKTA